VGAGYGSGVSSTRRPLYRGYTVHAYLKDATGLASYSRVMVAGIPVGNISGIKLEHGMARVDVKMHLTSPSTPTPRSPNDRRACSASSSW